MSVYKRILGSKKIKILAMFTFLLVIVATTILAHDYNPTYEGYPYWEDEYIEYDEIYIDSAPNYLYDLISIPEPSHPNTWTFGRWHTAPNGGGTHITPGTTPIIAAVETAYTQWDGIMRFTNGTSVVDVRVPENMSITTAASAGLPNNFFPPHFNVSANANMPYNPTHIDPSFVFMGWRITTGPLAGNILNRGQAAQLIMSVANSQNGFIPMEAVWYQRVVFTKTGENLYPADLDTIERLREPRNGARFEIRRLDEETSTWELVPNMLVSTSGAQVEAIGSTTDSDPFAVLVPPQPGRVVGNRPLTATGQYRLIEIMPPLGYQREGGYWDIVTTQTPAGDVRIEGFVHVNHDLYFVDWNRYAEFPNMDITHDWTVGNLRPRLIFSKLNRTGDLMGTPDNLGAVFVIEQRPHSNAPWSVVYTTQPSGTAIPAFPRPVQPSTPPESYGQVVITRPFTPTYPGATFQYRLREISAPDGYLIPTGYWNITVDRYSGVLSLSRVGAALGFRAETAPQDAANNWSINLDVSNSPTRFWPFIKTDIHFTSPNEHEYLGGAVFRLFVYNGTDTPARTPITTDMVIPTPNTPTSGTWSLVIEISSTGGSYPTPMWFPMMPGRVYQLVEVKAPIGFQLPWGQWRISVTGAVCDITIQGAGLSTQVIDVGAPGTVNIIHIEDYVYLGDCTPNCPEDCEEDHNYYIDAYFVINMTEIDLPMTGGVGNSLLSAIGFAVISIAMILLAMKKMLSQKKNVV